MLGFLIFLYCGLICSEFVSMLVDSLSAVFEDRGLNNSFISSVFLSAFGSLYTFTP